MTALCPMLPHLFKVRSVHRETSDTRTLVLEGTGPFSFQPGQFNMLYMHGIGEIPVSISGPARPGPILHHTIRNVGAVSRALVDIRRGTSIGVRGPFGTGWPLANARGGDLLLLAGGIGLAPLRPALYHALGHRSEFRNVTLLYGARTPEERIFVRELALWSRRSDLDLRVILDVAPRMWPGPVGVVTTLLDTIGLDAGRTTAFLCGPERMMTVSVPVLERIGIPPDRVHLSLERNMKCALGLCGHCQMGSYFVCRDGPVFPLDRIRPWLAVPEM